MIVDFKKKNGSHKIVFPFGNPKVILPIGLAILLLSLFFVDKPLALYLQESRLPLDSLLLFFYRIFSPMLWLLLLPFAFFYIRFLGKLDRKSRKLWVLSLSIPTALLGTSILQMLLGRSNPEWLFFHGEMILRPFQWNPAFHAFPNSTSTLLAAFGMTLHLLQIKRRKPVFLSALVLAFVPVFVKACFLSDALVGIAIGIYLASLVFQVMRRELTL